MNRRHVLGAAASAGGAWLSGCSTTGTGPVDLGHPAEERDGGGREKHLIYTRDEDRQAVLTVGYRGGPAADGNRIPVRLHVWHREGLRTDRLAFRLRAPLDPTGVPAGIYLQVPAGGPWPAFDLRREDRWAVIEVDALGGLGEGSLGLDLVIEPVAEPVAELALQAELEFATTERLARRYRATANTRFDLEAARG